MFKFKQVAGMSVIHGLMLLGVATAWAGRGDVDPNYGEGGRLQIPPAVLLALPGDRLVIADGGTGEGFRVRMVDATGQNVLSFGDGGIVLIDSETFLPEAAALGPNGDMIFAGSLSTTQARGLLRLDKDGQPVLSFGDRGDGFVEPAVTTTGAMSFAVDPDGKVFLAEGSWNTDGSCESTARLQRLLPNGQPDTGFGVDGILEIPNLDICNGAPVFGTRADGGVIVGHGQTIVAINAAGDIDPTFGVDGRLVVNEVAWPSGLLLPDGGVLIFGLRGVSPTANNTVFLKFDRNGQPDLDYGQGRGSVTVDLGAELLGKPFALEAIDQLALDPDGEHIVARLRVFEFNGAFSCGGISRLAIDGTPDRGFGRNGLTCLNFDFASVVAVQSNGAPLFRLPDFDSENGILYRLLPDNRPSPGFLRVVTASFWFNESEKSATVAVERLAGRDGAVSVAYATSSRPPGGTLGDCSGCGHRWDSATAGSDYTTTSGRLDWASGDDTERTVTVSILDDDINEITEIFGVDFSEPSGVVELVPCRVCDAVSASIFITDNGTATTPPPPPPPPPPASGGGGSVSWTTQLVLLTLLFIRRRRIRRAD